MSDAEPTPGVSPTGRWATFRGWHADPDFWQDLYRSTLVSLIWVTLAYVVAALYGEVSKWPLVVPATLLVVLIAVMFGHEARALYWHYKGRSQLGEQDLKGAWSIAFMFGAITATNVGLIVCFGVRLSSGEATW